MGEWVTGTIVGHHVQGCIPSSSPKHQVVEGQPIWAMAEADEFHDMLSHLISPVNVRSSKIGSLARAF